MKNIAIIVDSSAVLDPVIQNHPDVYTAHLTLSVEEQAYLDQLEFSHQQILDALKEDKVMTSAMPSLGEIMRVYKEVDQKNYDHIFVLSVSSHVSGTHSGFVMVQEELKIKHLEVIDTYSIAGTVGYMTQVLLDLAQQDATLEQMKLAIKQIIDNTIVYILPNNLERLVKSGRVHKAVGTLTNLLKLKVVLVFKNKGKQIEKWDITRTQKRALSKIADALKQFGVTTKDWKLIILDIDETSPVAEMKAAIKEKFNDIEVLLQNLPSTLALHGGLGTIVIQAVKKVNY